MNLDSCPYKVVAIIAARALWFQIPEGLVGWDGCPSGLVFPGAPPSYEICVVVFGPQQRKRVMLVSVTQSCPTFCNPVDCSPPGSSVHGMLQARIPDWVAIPFSRGSSQHKD